MQLTASRCSRSSGANLCVRSGHASSGAPQQYNQVASARATAFKAMVRRSTVQLIYLMGRSFACRRFYKGCPRVCQSRNSRDGCGRQTSGEFSLLSYSSMLTFLPLCSGVIHLGSHSKAGCNLTGYGGDSASVLCDSLARSRAQQKGVAVQHCGEVHLVVDEACAQSNLGNGTEAETVDLEASLHPHIG